MTTPLMCLAFMIWMPFLTKIPVAIAMKQLNGRYDNHHPRAQQSQLTGWGARALASHQNTFEALIIFTPAVLISQWSHTIGAGDSQIVLAKVLALVFVGCRILYPIFYIKDLHLARSTVWSIGFLCSAWMALLPLFHS